MRWSKITPSLKTDKEELLKEIEELNQTVDYPELFLKNFFKDLRDDIDKEVETKKKNLQKKDKNYTKLNEILLSL